MSEERCIHGKTLEEDCDPCDALLQASGLLELVDAMVEEGVELPEESEACRRADELLKG